MSRLRSTTTSSGAARDLITAGVAAGADLVAVHGGTPLHRRLVTEEARLGCGVPALLVEDADDDAATTAILAGRTDLVGRPPSASSSPTGGTKTDRTRS